MSGRNEWRVLAEMHNPRLSRAASKDAGLFGSNWPALRPLDDAVPGRI
jgi:hypothetical protein